MEKIKIIALYLPQYHPTPKNDLWWGAGFTEWTNVGKAKKLFPGHYQPRIPADLGYYDLRLPESREAQAKMASEYGIAGFCYYHYYFGNGKRELELPFQEVLNSGTPDFPFCLAWANESWYAKSWDIDKVNTKKLLIEQRYDDEEDYVRHFNLILPALRDPRYITVDNKPIFMIYRPRKFLDVENFLKVWRQLALANDLPGIYFIAQSKKMGKESKKYLAQGFDAVNSVRLHNYDKNLIWYKKLWIKLQHNILQFPKIMPYCKAAEKFIMPEDALENIIPTIITGWDHTPRSGKNGSVMTGFTPEHFSRHVKSAIAAVKNKQPEHQIIFLKSWNEWGEGNYIEPDLKFGKQFLDVVRKLVNS